MKILKKAMLRRSHINPATYPRPASAVPTGKSGRRIVLTGVPSGRFPTVFSAVLSTILTAVLCLPSPAMGFDASKFQQSKGLRILEEIQDTISQLAEHVTPTVVGVSTITTPSRPGDPPPPGGPRFPGSGSGVVIHEDGYIVTNNHVIGNGAHAEIRFADHTMLIANVVGRDPDTDLALLKVDADHALPSATFGNSGLVKIGQWVLAVGNPFGLDRTVTLGVVSGMGRDNMNLSRYENFIQTDASINPGNSGGPLFNLRGEVIGINTAIINLAQGIGFAIPSNMANRVIRQLKTGGTVVRGWLGVGIQPLTPLLAGQLNVEAGLGILVNDVFADDPADRAGIRTDDIITHISDERLTSPDQLSRVVAGFAPGDDVSVRVIRDGETHRFRVTLGRRRDESATPALRPTATEINLGIDVSPLTEDLAGTLSMEPYTGVVVVDVVKGSVAYAEGIHTHDVIKEINREAVPTMQDFRRIVDAMPPGETILLRILRETKTFFVVLKPSN